jgi:hypothetical protein
MQKISKFFGVDPISQSFSKSPANKRNVVLNPTKGRLPSGIFSPSPSSPDAQLTNNNKHNTFFGERPPDEVIVDQLEQFFPAINTDNQEQQDITTQLKNIVQANLMNKRSSRRASSMMIRRQTQRESSRSTRPLGLISAGKLGADPLTYDSSRPGGSTETKIVKEHLPSVSEPQPITFRWVPGNLIGQGSFGKVFHALNLDTGDFLAVKQVIAGQDIIQMKKSNDSLLREIELLSELDHDNIVRYFGKVSS